MHRWRWPGATASPRLNLAVAVYRRKQLGPLEQFDEQKLQVRCWVLAVGSWCSPVAQLLGELFQFVQFQDGQVVFREGDEGDSFFIIVSGEVKMEATSPVSLEPEYERVVH